MLQNINGILLGLFLSKVSEENEWKEWGEYMLKFDGLYKKAGKKTKPRDESH